MSTADSTTPKLSPYDWKVYNIKKEQMFKGTIAVCIIYGTIAAVLMICCYLFTEVRDILFVQFLPFTLVYIIGTIIIIIALIIYILTFKASKVNIYPEYPEVSCPDYWDMEILDESSSNLFDKTLNKDLFRYRCVLNSNLFNNLEIAKINADNGTPYSISDSYNITGLKDIADTNKLAMLSTQNVEDNQFRRLYRNINDYNANGGLNSEVYSNLLLSSLIMNNYEYNSNDQKFSNLQDLTSNQAIPPMSWKHNPTDAGISLTDSVANVGNCFSIIKDWNGITYTMLKSAYGNNQIGVYLRNGTGGKQGTHVGTITLDDETSNILYATKVDIVPSSTVGRTAIVKPINKAILDMIIVAQTPAQRAQIEKAMKDKSDALKSQIDKFRQTGQSSQLAKSDNSGVSTGANRDLTSCISGDLSNNNSDSLGIPPPYVEIIPLSKQSSYLPKDITNNAVFTSNIPLVCDSFYPLFMSYADNNNTSSNLSKNALRCNYSKICGVPWSDMQCSSTAEDYMADYGFNGASAKFGDGGKLGVNISF